MTKHGKKYVEAEKQIPAEPVSPLAAMKLLKEISVANFDETVTGDFRLGIDTRQADQQLRGTVSLPNGSGKTVRVAVFAEGAAAQAAEEAGADIVGTDELMQQIQAGEFNFDAAVATPDQMGKVGRLGKIPRPPRSHAQPEARHRHQRCGEGHQGAQGRPRGVPRRPLRHRARRPRQGELQPPISSPRTTALSTTRSCA